MLSAVWYAWLAVEVAGAVALVARGIRRGLPAPTIVRLVLGHLIGATLVGIGLIALLLDGYVEEYGDEPLHTLVVAVPSLLVGITLFLVTWRRFLAT